MLPDRPSRPPESDEHAPELSLLRASNAGQWMQGERRVITILFCDVVGSTDMAEKLDPEEWAEIMDEAFDYLTEPVRRYEGTVARLMGDGILAFFGAPLAHEDDPQRAVLAGLDIVSGIQPFIGRTQREYGLDFNVRVGISTGPVVIVGEIGSDVAVEYTAMGDAVNLAARMEQTALPGSVQVAESTYRLVAPMFDFEILGGIQVKGKSEPVRAFRILDRKVKPGRLRGIAGLESPLVGRAREIDALGQAVADLCLGRGGIIALIGDAGLGKSRLIEEVKAMATGDGSSPEGSPGDTQVDAGLHLFEAALEEARRQGSRRSQWPVLAELARLTGQQGDAGQAEILRREGREVVE